ncbi:MAG: GH3 auxin-responsive promoter family protein [Treponema sp.]|nr:GH3 auxin-responsive promoter family protein [Treponema sp.]
MKKEKNANLITFALSWVGRKNKKILDKAAKNCAKAEEATLRSILEYAKDSEWGKAHNFDEILSAKSADELFSLYQNNVPPQDYEDLRPFIERHKNGEENILFPGKPMMYATTSGTTKEPKWIPITPAYYQNVFSKMSKLWLYTFIMHRPKTFWGKCVSIVGKSIEGYAPDGTVCGSVSGVTQRDCPEFIKGLYSAPSEVFAIKDYTARYYSLMRTGIEQNVSLLITANPSTIIELQKNVDAYLDDYIDDIEHGTLSSKMNIEPENRAALEARYKPNPKRAAELKALKEKYGRILPKHYWPNLQLVTTWHCGNTSVYRDKYKDFFPEQTLDQEFGYFASECRAGLVMNGGDDTVLFPHNHYFEFVEAESVESGSPKFLQLHELQKGKRYVPYITTYGGLYRYNMNDLVECSGAYGTIPTIRFIQKINGIVSMTGEKLSERQFIDAVGETEKDTGEKLNFFVGFADIQESAYHFYFEFQNKSLGQDFCDQFAAAIDKKLKAENLEYAAKRDSFRVKEPAGHLLVENSFEKYKALMIKNGARDGQFKMNLLMQDDKRHDHFKELVRQQ